MSLDTGAPVDLSEELVRRLRGVGRAVTPGEIGELWIFPPLEDVEESAEFLLFTRLSGNGDRRLYSARMGRSGPREGEAEEPAGDVAAEAPVPGEPSTNGRRQRITDHGTIPADRVPRLVERFRRRVEAEGHEPVHVVVDGASERWRELLPDGAADGDGPRGNGTGGNGAGPGGDGTEDRGSGYGGSNGAEPAAA